MNDQTITIEHKIGPSFYAEFKAAGVKGDGFSWNDDGLNIMSNIDPAQLELLRTVIANHDASRPDPGTIAIPDNPTLGDWRVGLALWVREDNNGHPITWLDYLTQVVKQLVDSGHPLGQVIVQRLEYSNNVKRVELLQLKEFFQFSEDQVNESLRRAYIVSLGDLTQYDQLPSKYL